MRPKVNAVFANATADSGARIRLIGLALAIFIPLAVLTAGVLYLLFETQDEALQHTLYERELKAVELGQQRMTIALETVISDLRFLAKQSALHRWLANDTPQTRQALIEEYTAFITEKVVYNHVSYYDIDQERVLWVHRQVVTPEGENEIRAEIVPAVSLHQVFDAADHDKVLRLEKDHIYVSPFRLKTMRGAAETDVVPMVGYAVAIYNQAGEKVGVLHVKFLAEQLLRRVKALRDQGSIWVVNAEGQWLLRENPDADWTLSNQNGEKPSFAQVHPQGWAHIQAQPRGGQFMANGDLYSYIRITGRVDSLPSAGLNDTSLGIEMPRLFIVTHVSADEIAAERRAIAQPLITLGAILLLLCLIISAVVAAQILHRRRAAEFLKASEARFRAVLESAPDAVIISDTEGKIVLANAQVERLFGYKRDNLIGHPVEMLMPARFRNGHKGHRTKYAEEPKARGMGVGQTLYGLRADGSEFPVSISLSPAETESGILVIADIRDVTNQQQIENRIKELNARLTRDNTELAALNKELESFSYSVSHDLRAPLRAIDGFSQALQEDYEERLDDAGKGYLTRIRQAAQRMGQLIDDLLRLSKVTRANMDPQDVDLTELAQDIAANLQMSDPSRAAEFQIAPNMKTRGDAQLLQIALENLLGNAWKFTGNRNPARIEFGTTSQGKETTYFIKDNGAGFDMAYVGQLFGAFRRLHDARTFPGTGIGLATVQRIIHRHAGRIWAEAAVDQGATFYFTLNGERMGHGT